MLQYTKLLAIIILFSFQIIGIAQNKVGDILYDDVIIHTIRITFDHPKYWQLLVHAREQSDSLRNNQYVAAPKVSIDGKEFYAVGIRFKGESSYEYSIGKKKSFRIKLDEFVKCQEYDGITAINLNNSFRDPTMMREKIYLDYSREVGGYAPRAAYARVYINNTYWGLYLMVENVDKEFLTANFEDDSGDLFKADFEGKLSDEGYDPINYKRQYAKATNKKKDDWTGFIQFINTLHKVDSRKATFNQQFDKIFNVGPCLKSWVVNTLLFNVDTYNLGHHHNFYLYQNPKTQQFEWIAYDGNYTFAAWYEDYTLGRVYGTPLFYIDSEEESPLVQALLLNNTTYRQQYIQIAKEIVEQITQESVAKKVAKLYALIRPAVQDDLFSMYTLDDFDRNISTAIEDYNFNNLTVPGIQDFFSKRRFKVVKELKTLK